MVAVDQFTNLLNNRYLIDIKILSKYVLKLVKISFFSNLIGCEAQEGAE